jgi:nucleoside-diphosphate-sugar epimerase
MILVTGAAGLIGRHFCARLEREGRPYRGFDLRIAPEQDTRDPAALARALDGVAGVVHLAAVSRVVPAQNNPGLCQATNVDALRSLLSLCRNGQRPWLVFGSSREVYGQPSQLPVAEDAPRRPMNVYARSKVAGEDLVEEARQDGLIANIVRFSSVFGCPLDHPDRVAMAFAWAACRGGTMRLEGGGNIFDFTFIHDVVDGLWRLAQASDAAGQGSRSAAARFRRRPFHRRFQARGNLAGLAGDDRRRRGTRAPDPRHDGAGRGGPCASQSRALTPSSQS